jgi:heterodisulfide reductase subunit C
MAELGVLSLGREQQGSQLLMGMPAGGQLLYRCLQCGTCSASCPAVFAMDYTPRQVWRMCQLGLLEQVLRSQTMWLCSMCYLCQLRCPRGIPLADLMTDLKRLAMQRGLVASRPSRLFYRSFAQVAAKYGRMRELEFMARYLLLAGPARAVRYARLGLSMLRRGKLQLELPRLRGPAALPELAEQAAKEQS